jgi:hypothetical protein
MEIVISFILFIYKLKIASTLAAGSILVGHSVENLSGRNEALETFCRFRHAGVWVRVH